MAFNQPQISVRSEVRCFDKMKELEETIVNLRRERDSIAAELASCRSENKRLQDELVILQQKLDVLQPKAILTRIEKTLELVDQMDAVQDSDSSHLQSSPHIPHTCKDFDDNGNTEEVGILDEEGEEPEYPTQEEEDKGGVHKQKFLAPDVSIKEELKPAISSCVPSDFIHYDDATTGYKRHQKAVDGESQHNSQDIVDLQTNEEDIKADLFLKIEVDEAAVIEDTQVLDNLETEKSLSENHEDVNDDKTSASDCLACDYTYDNPLEYKRHLKAAHGLKYKNFKCFHCGKVLQRLCALEKHMERHHKNAAKPGGHCTAVVIDEGSVPPPKKIGKRRIEKTVRSCILCGFTSDKRLGVLHHGMAEHGWTETRRLCNQCPFVGVTANRLRVHFESAHEGKKKQCTECGKMVSRKGMLGHIRSVHKQLRYNCPHCEHVAKRVDYLTDHINFQHKGICYYCDKCPYSAPSKGRLWKHIKTHHDVGRRNRDPNALPLPPEKKFHCDQCVFSATCNASLKEHIAVKHEGKRYYCDQCGYKCKGPQPLRLHIRTKHENFRFSCEHCDTRFMNMWRLRQHNQKRLKQTKQYKCDICEMVFCFEIGLNKHKRHVHSSDKDILPCDECEKVFYSQQNLNRHKRMAHRMEKFSCGECDRVFNYRQTLNEHVRDKHMLAAKLEN